MPYEQKASEHSPRSQCDAAVASLVVPGIKQVPARTPIIVPGFEPIKKAPKPQYREKPLEKWGEDPASLLELARISLLNTSNGSDIRAETLLRRNADIAIVGLLPIAIGEWGPDRRTAEAAVRQFDQDGFRLGMLEVAKQYGEMACRSLEEILAHEKLLKTPRDDRFCRGLLTKISKMPAFGWSRYHLDSIGRQDSPIGILALLRIIAQRKVGTAMQSRAHDWLDLIAARRDLSVEELEKQFILDVGFDNAGCLRLDYGPRAFTARFTKDLAIELVNEDGLLLKALPAPRKSDDPELTAAAKQQLSELRKDVRSLLSLQKTRLERAMSTERRWTGAEFRKYILNDPVTRQLARKLVWALFGTNGIMLSSFRIDGAGTSISACGEPVLIYDSDAVGIAHPVHFDSGLSEWNNLFAQEQIEQPFRQLLRTTYRSEDNLQDNYFGLQGATVTTRGLVWLDREDWEIGGEDKWDFELYRSYPEGTIKVTFEPGIYVVRGGTPDEHQTITIKDFPELPPVAFSEAIRQLMMIRVE